MKPLCKDCKHHNHRTCQAPQNMKIDLVDGGLKFRNYEYCSTHRDDGVFLSWVFNTCSIRGRWFERKQDAR